MLQVPTRKLVAGSTALSSPKMIRGLYTRDNMVTYDAATLDSTGAFLVGQLERLDPLLHMPLMDFSWSRDIDLREDVSVSDESSSYTVSSFAASGGLKGSGKAWASLDATTLARVSVDKGKVVNPLTLWAAEVGFTVVELEQSIRLGTSIDTEQLEALRMKDQADTDAQVYIGDTDLGVYGLVNANNRSDASQVTNLSNVATVSGATTWAAKIAAGNPDAVLADFNEILTSTWSASGFAVFPDRIGLPTSQYGLISTSKVSSAGNVSLMTYILENNIAARSKRPLEIVPMKWLNGMGVGGTPQTLGTVDRMIAYNKNSRFVRFPKVPLQATNVQFRGLWQIMPYYGKLGVVEIVYPETIAYRDGL